MFHCIQTYDFLFLGNSQAYNSTDHKESDGDGYYGP